jgi:hypothetical protein
MFGGLSFDAGQLQDRQYWPGATLGNRGVRGPIEGVGDVVQATIEKVPVQVQCHGRGFVAECDSAGSMWPPDSLVDSTLARSGSRRPFA